MEMGQKKEFDLYKDIQNRTNGEVYLGIVGPVRTGKSTFIKRFMDLMVLPLMEDANERERALDELPQSAQGRTIMTTEPKFVPCGLFGGRRDRAYGRERKPHGKNAVV